MSEHKIARTERKFSRARDDAGYITAITGSGSSLATSAGTFAAVSERQEPLLQWYLSRQDTPPENLTYRDRLGDGGDPEWTAEFQRWMFGEQWTRTEVSEGSCEHPLRQPGALCQRCSVYNEAGEPIAETGRYRITRRLYVYPMRAAVARLRRVAVPDGLPPLPTMLFALASSGHVPTAIDSLMGRYPGLADGGRAHGHVQFALRRVRDAYTEEPRPNLRRRKSDAQLDAEAVPME